QSCHCLRSRWACRSRPYMAETAFNYQSADMLRHRYRGAGAVGVIVTESPRTCETSQSMYVWLRMCVAFGVLSGLPVPTGDRLASLHAGSLLRLDGSTEPGLATRGRLDRRQHPEMLPPCLSPPCPHRTLRHRDRAPAPTCPRTSRETLRRRKQSKYRPLS